MWKKLLMLGVMGMACAGAWGQVSVIAVTDEDKHARKEDFYHTFEYYVFPGEQKGGAVGKCQATRIGRRWFATAAHCVQTYCSNGCRVQMDLLEQPVSALAQVVHSAKEPAVFIHPEYGEKPQVQNDFALIRLDLDRAPITYYRRPSGKRKYNRVISKKEFNAFLSQTPAAARQFNRVVSPEFPAVVVFGQQDYQIARKLSVVSIFNGKREIKPNPHPAYYAGKFGFAFTRNFGIRKGMSGSGVMSNTGELMGIISANITARWGEKKAEEFFMFPVFNTAIVSFMEETMGSDFYKLDRKDASPDFVRTARPQDKTMAQAVKWATQHGFGS